MLCGVLQKLGMTIQLLSVAKDAYRVAPAKPSFWSACILLTMSKVRSLLFGKELPDRIYSGHRGEHIFLSIPDWSARARVDHPTGVWWECTGELSESVNKTIEQFAT